MLINYDFAPFLGEETLIYLYSSFIIILLAKFIGRISKNDFRPRHFYNVVLYFLLSFSHILVYILFDWGLDKSALGFTLFLITAVVFMYLIYIVSDNIDLVYYINRPKKGNYAMINEIICNDDSLKCTINGKYTKATNFFVFKNTTKEEASKFMEEISSYKEVLIPKSSKKNKIHLLLILLGISVFEFLNISIIMYLYLK